MEAYWNTDYRVLAAPPITLTIGVPNAAFDALLTQREAACAAMLTAFNPYSRRAGEADNAAAQCRLKRVLDAAGYAMLEAEGIGRDERWPAEPKFLIFGIPLEAAKRLARQFRQNAFVWLEPGQAAALVFVRPAAAAA